MPFKPDPIYAAVAERTVDAIVASLAKENWKFSALVTAIAKSEPMRLRRGKAQ